MGGGAVRMSVAEFNSIVAKKGRTPTSKDRNAKFHAIGRLPKNKMNKTEEAYSVLLDQQKQAGEILDWKFHPMNVRLADNTFYEVDFLVVAKDRELQIHETKGTYTTEVGNIKIKLCAEVLPWFRFIKCIKQAKKNGGGWEFKEY